MRDGEKFRLGDLCSIIKGETPIKQAVPGPYPLVVTATERASHESYQFDCKAVIVPLVSSTGHGHASIKRINYQVGKFALGSILCAVIPKDEQRLNPKFLHVYFSYFKDQLIVPLMKGSANVSLSLGALADLKIIVPPMAVQQRVIDLAENDELMKPLEHEIIHQQSLLTKLKQAILQEAIQGKLTADWRATNPDTEPASDLLRRIQAEKAKLIAAKKIKSGARQDAIDDDRNKLAIPKCWKLPHLNDITVLVTDGTHQTPTYTSSGRIFLSAQNVKPFRFMPEQHKFVSEKAFVEYTSNRKPELGDLLLGRVGAGIGETAVIDRHMEFAFYVSLGLVKTFKQHTVPQYLAIVFNSPYGVRYARGNTSSKGGSAGNFNLGRIRSLRIPLPPLAEQAAIVERVEALMATCRSLETEIENSRTHASQLLQAILKEAFTPAS